MVLMIDQLIDDVGSGNLFGAHFGQRQVLHRPLDGGLLGAGGGRHTDHVRPRFPADQPTWKPDKCELPNTETATTNWGKTKARLKASWKTRYKAEARKEAKAETFKEATTATANCAGQNN